MAFFPDSLRFHRPACEKKQQHAEVPCPSCAALVPRSFLGEHVKRCPEARAESRRRRPAQPPPLSQPAKPGGAAASPSHTAAVPPPPSQPPGTALGGESRAAGAGSDLRHTLAVLVGACDRLAADHKAYEDEVGVNQQVIDNLRRAGIAEQDLRQPIQVSHDGARVGLSPPLCGPLSLGIASGAICLGPCLEGGSLPTSVSLA